MGACTCMRMRLILHLYHVDGRYGTARECLTMPALQAIVTLRLVLKKSVYCRAPFWSPDTSCWWAVGMHALMYVDAATWSLHWSRLYCWRLWGRVQAKYSSTIWTAWLDDELHEWDGNQQNTNTKWEFLQLWVKGDCAKVSSMAFLLSA